MSTIKSCCAALSAMAFIIVSTAAPVLSQTAVAPSVAPAPGEPAKISPRKAGGEQPVEVLKTPDAKGATQPSTTSGAQKTIRVINNSETEAATVDQKATKPGSEHQEVSTTRSSTSSPGSAPVNGIGGTGGGRF